MSEEATQDQVLEAARSLDQAGFTRQDVADELGAEISAMQPGWKAAKQAGLLEKVGDEAGKRQFRVVNK